MDKCDLASAGDAGRSVDLGAHGGGDGMTVKLPMTGNEASVVYFWTYYGEHIMFIQDKDGDENFHLYAVNVHDASCRDLTPISGVTVSSMWRHPAFPDEIVFCMNQRDRCYFDAFTPFAERGADPFGKSRRCPGLEGLTSSLRPRRGCG